MQTDPASIGSAYAGRSIASADAAISASGRYRVEFTGSAGEYFRIWIANLALTIVTLGIYSAWAKVRKRRYFYGHTRVDGDAFEYRGNPVAILKGRLIAVAAFGVFYAVGHFAPIYFVVLIPAAIALAPWLVVRSLAFNARNSAFRNTTFHFRGTYGRCLAILLWNGLIVVVTFGIGYPYLKSRLVQFMAANHYYGATQFEVPELKPIFFRIYSWAIGLGILLGVILAAIAWAVGFSIGGGVESTESAKETIGIAGNIMTFGTYLAWIVVYAYLRARLANATFNNLAIGSWVRFECTLRARDLLGIYVVNILAIVCTLGLAAPWAVVRLMRYRAEHLTLLAPSGLDRFVAKNEAPVSAAGEEMAEMFDIDLSI